MTVEATVRPVSVNIDEAARLTGVSRYTILAEIKAGRLVAHYPTSRALILLDELHSWVASAPTEKRG